MPRIAYRIIWIISSIAIVAMTIFFAGQPYVAPPSGTLRTFTIKDNSFSIKRPENWKSNGLAMHDMVSEVLYQPSSNIYFHVTTDLQGSLLSSMLPTGISSGPDAPVGTDTANFEAAMKQIPGGEKLAIESKKTPLERLHEAQLAQFEKQKEKFPNYKDGTTSHTTVGGTEALLTDFTLEYDNGFLGKKQMFGRRYTLLTSERQVSIVCYCLKELKPEIDLIFEKMLKSLDLHPKGA